MVILLLMETIILLEALLWFIENLFICGKHFSGWETIF
jgi:hypothetical protein